ncbi:MAG: protein kinase domain-containing protein [Burkholderiales bacterium]
MKPNDALLEHGHVGRFELRRILGQGAQATVWLAFDPRLEREVAVKLMRSDKAGPTQGDHPWLQEARHVSRIKHAHIVPVYEADTHQGQPYLVFEYVAGPTLSEHLKKNGPMPPSQAVPLMLGVLDALHTAHASGVVHRDLKPSNILVDAAGLARVMDFGIAALLTTHAQAQPQAGSAVAMAALSGTPGYMAPEAADGAAPAPSMDVFAAGLVLAELLSGKPLVAEKDPYRAIYRIAHEDLKLPAHLGSEVDDGLRAIVQRALARNPLERHASAADFRDALKSWLSPQAAATDAVDVGKGHSGTLEFLLRRMRHKSDFPALSDSVGRIQRVANSENESLGSLSAEILQDVALTNKLLRMVNTAHFSHAGGGGISTVSRAVALVGFAGIRNMALSVVLLEHMQDKTHAHVLKEEFLRSLMAGSLATELCPVAREGEEAFIGALFQNLGRLLTEFYFPEEARQVRNAVAAQADKHNATNAEEAAATNVLGLSFEDLGVGVAKTWGLPDSLQKTMRKPQGEPPPQLPNSPTERQRWLALACNDMAGAMIKADGPARGKAVAELAKRYAATLGVKPKDIEAAAVDAQQKLAAMAKAMGLQLHKSSQANSLLTLPHAASADTGSDSLSPHVLHATAHSPLQGVGEAPSSGDAQNSLGNRPPAADVLAAGIQDITNSMVENFKLNEVLRMILETMFRALGFRRIVFCLRDPKTNTLTGRFGLGDKAATVAQAFKVSLNPSPDLFTAICLKGMDTLIADTRSGTVGERLPDWYRKEVNAPSFLLLPLQMKGATFALIYADKEQSGDMALGERELSLLRTLRNQGVMAFKQAS